MLRRQRSRAQSTWLHASIWTSRAEQKCCLWAKKKKENQHLLLIVAMRHIKSESYFPVDWKAEMRETIMTANTGAQTSLICTLFCSFVLRSTTFTKCFKMFKLIVSKNTEKLWRSGHVGWHLVSVGFIYSVSSISFHDNLEMFWLAWVKKKKKKNPLAAALVVMSWLWAGDWQLF